MTKKDFLKRKLEKIVSSHRGSTKSSHRFLIKILRQNMPYVFIKVGCFSLSTLHCIQYGVLLGLSVWQFERLQPRFIILIFFEYGKILVQNSLIPNFSLKIQVDS